MFNQLYLTCPVVRPAKSDDAEAIAEVLLDCNSLLINEVFQNNRKGALALLTSLYTKHYQGVYVLQEGETIIGVMKIHLPRVKMGKTISLFSLMRNLGILRGFRAMLLLSNWDEYKLSAGETYIEFMYVSNSWKGLGCEKILFDRAVELSISHNSIYLTKFESLRSYKDIGHLDQQGFTARRKIHSPIAKLVGATYVWRKYTFALSDTPITVREYVINKFNEMRTKWQVRRRESDAALRVSLIMTVIPIVGGTLAGIRGYPLAAIGWGILILMHMSGALLLLREFFFGKYVISIAMVSESINLLSRAMMSSSWFDRSWLLPLALMNLWVLNSVMRAPKIKELKKFEETNSLITMNEIIQKGKISY